jgi:hypothetical protein
MTLFELFSTIPARLNSKNAPSNTFVFGFVTPQAQLSLSFNQGSAQLRPDIKEAEYLVVASLEDFALLLSPQAPGRAALAERLEMRPAYPFSNYLLSIFLAAFDLAIPDLDYRAKAMETVFPFPPRYPAAENSFRQRLKPPLTAAPALDASRLPVLVADHHPEWRQIWDFAWQQALSHFRSAPAEAGFVANFMDAAFNDHIFMWDSCFMTLFGHYGRRVFDYIGTLDNFYAKQHDDGFICREISILSGKDVFQSLDPRSTGPNILAWTEWQHYQHSQDRERLAAVFPLLVAYQRWWRDWRSHPNGGYWSSGWGSGMDNQVRVPHSEFHHRHYLWIDANAQMALASASLLQMAAVLGRDEFDAELQQEHQHLQRLINDQLWDEQAGFYSDAAPDGRLSSVKSIGAFWTLLAGVVPAARLPRLLAQLTDQQTFNRPHRVPSQSADSAAYNVDGGYWLGAVWAPTNYMVLAGLAANDQLALAREIALNHVTMVAQVFAATGTLWENYAPEHPHPGRPAGRDFVGWTGLSAISIPLEYLIGLRLKPPTLPTPMPMLPMLQWDVWLLERHGVQRYPLGRTGCADLICQARSNALAPLVIEIETDTAFVLHIGQQAIHCPVGQSTINAPMAM